MEHCVFKDVFIIYLKCKKIVEVNPFRSLSMVPDILQDFLVVSAKIVVLKLATVSYSSYMPST